MNKFTLQLKQANQVKLFVKKVWFSLIAVLLLVLGGCTHRIATKDNSPKDETTTQNQLIEQSSKKNRNGWVLTERPHPKVLEMHEGFGIHRDRFKFYFDTLYGAINKNEAIQITKLLLNCPPEDDFIYFAEDNFLNKKSIKNGKNAKFGKWHHKGMEVDDYRFNFSAVDQGKVANRLVIKYNKEFDVDLSGLLSIDSAMQIVKANANPRFLSNRFCWDAPYNQQCSPKINMRIFPIVKMYAIQDYVLYYMFCIDKEMSDSYCKIGRMVNAKTGETMPTASPAGNARTQKQEETYKKDTVTIGGYNIVDQPNEYISEIKFRRGNRIYDSFKIQFSSNGNKLSEEEKLQVIKQMFNMDGQVFSYYKKEDRWQLMYKGIEVERFVIKIDGQIATGSVYPEMDLDVTVNVTEQEAFEAAKADFSKGNKHVAFYFEYPDLPSWREGKKIPEDEQNLPKGELKIRYFQPHNKFYFSYRFVLPAFADDRAYFIDPKTKEIQLQNSTRL